ncbi:Phage Mu protein F like protein [compost metagenome]
MDKFRFKRHLNQLEAHYKDACCEHQEPLAIDLSGWQKLIEQMGKDLQSGKIKPGDLNQSFIRQTYQEVNKAAGSGYGKDWNKKSMEELPNPMITKMKQNIYMFSAAKNAAMLLEINERMYDGNRLRTPDELAAILDGLNIKYNKNWLATELITATHSGQMAQKWESIESNRKLFPNLKYKTQGDDRVRPEHEKLDGIIAPIDSPFWDKYYPPNGPRCRCDAIQTAEPVSRDIPNHVEGVTPVFQNNLGKTAQIYNEDKYPYFVMSKELPQFLTNFNASKEFAPIEKVTTPKGNNVDINIFARQDSLKDHYESSVILADQLEQKVIIRPDLKDKTNITLDNKAAELIYPKTKQSDKHLKDAQEKGAEIVIFNLKNINGAEPDYLHALALSLQDPEQYPGIIQVSIIDQKGYGSLYLRADFVNKYKTGAHE